MLAEVKNKLMVKAFSLYEVGALSSIAYNSILCDIRSRLTGIDVDNLLGIELADKQLTDLIWFEVNANQEVVDAHERISFSNECVQAVNICYVGERYTY